ncbi:restriction endonuclease [Actinomyces radicidentis]|uniref:Restriction endonuclease n=1 Tax=Actinomyces radicidentis TaxID=111015 RepID=A0A0X8JFN5_ACTRD|nr:restriction endonuclease subunit S [Actinomyces radicidentis]AMD87722.1 restriction endonuclease [Actinomyces radicidentis]
MSRIDDMVRELGPDGVEFRALGEVAALRRGSGMPKSAFSDDGVPAIHYGHIYTRYGIYTRSAKAHVPTDAAESLQPVHPGELVIANTSENLEDVGKAVAWLGDSDAVTGGHATVVSSDVLDPKFLSYYVRTPAFFAQKRRFAFGTKVIELSAVNLAKIPFPVPPMSIQREIVGILDQFTELEAELEAELEERRRQYTRVADEIIWRRDGATPVAPLDELGALRRGRRFTRADFVSEGISAIHYGEVYTTYGTSTAHAVSSVRKDLAPSLRYAKPGDVIIAGVGETVADVGIGVAWLGDVPVAFHDDSFAFTSQLDPRYVSHVFRTPHYHRAKESFVSRAKVKRLGANGLGRIEIPVPNQERQIWIADQLDALEALHADLGSGLPAEIVARRQQYEYYRDKLLTFPERKDHA